MKYLQKHIHFFICIISVLLVGCSTAPKLPNIESKLGDRVGYLVDIGDSPAHTHVGTTVFNNFAKNAPYKWDLNAGVKQIVQQNVKKAGFTAVDLQAEGIRYSDVSDLIQAKDDVWQVVPGKEEAFRRLRDRLRLKAFIVLKEARVMASLECGGGPCSERYADTSGLFTRSFFGITRYSAVAAFQWNVFTLDPLADIARADPLRQLLRMPATHLPNFKTPVRFEDLTEEEFAPVKDAILKFTDTTAESALKALNPK